MGNSYLSIREVEDRYLVPSYPKFPLSIERGEGMYVFDEANRKYLDLYGGHAVCLLGHGHPRLVARLKEQASKLMFYSSVAYSSARAKAAQALAQFVGGDRKVFFSNSGSEANENAIKIAKFTTGRSTVVSLEGSFHGRTLGSLSITGIEKYRKGVSSHWVRFARFGDMDDLRSKIDDTVACVIMEPIQSLSGVNQASKKYFEETQKVCRANNSILIFDEIQTGLGRCGVPFYFHHLGIEPGIVTLAKGLAGGFPVGATVVRSEIASQIKMGDLGSTFGGGPLACALVFETIETLKEERLVENAAAHGRELHNILQEMKIGEVRGEGLLVGLRLDRPVTQLVQSFLEKDILVGASLEPNTIRLLPPLIVKEEELLRFVETLKEIL